MLASQAFRKLTTQSQYSGLRINGNYGLTILTSVHKKFPFEALVPNRLSPSRLLMA
jgi:hypothetical protein